MGSDSTKEFASYLDLANHHGNATSQDIEKICASVLTYGFNAAFLNPCFVPLAKSVLRGKAKVGTVISFPLGQETTDMKIASIRDAIGIGADELDIAPNTGFLLHDQKMEDYRAQLHAIVTAVREIRKDVIVKFILETGYLSHDQIKTGASIITEAGADFVKICSGMGPRGASLEDVAVVRDAIGGNIKIKVAGGIDTLAEANGFLDAGAHRIGTSKAVEIIKELLSSNPSSAPA